MHPMSPAESSCELRFKDNQELWTGLVTALATAAIESVRSHESIRHRLLLSFTHPAFEPLQRTPSYVAAGMSLLSETASVVTEKTERGECIDIVMAQIDSYGCDAASLVTLLKFFRIWGDDWQPSSLETLVSFALDFINNDEVQSQALALLNFLLAAQPRRRQNADLARFAESPIAKKWLDCLIEEKDNEGAKVVRAALRKLYPSREERKKMKEQALILETAGFLQELLLREKSALPNAGYLDRAGKLLEHYKQFYKIRLNSNLNM